MSANSASNYFQSFKKSLLSVYDNNEAQAIVQLLAQEVLGVEYTKLKFFDEALHFKKEAQLDLILERLLAHEPLQYILGYAYFMDLKFNVNSSTLIPRPETEELVKHILRSISGREESLHILDIGTGSGCIAIALKKQAAQHVVYAVDIHADTLTTATQNATLNATQIQFALHDILGDTSIFNGQPFDVIVSNPPYIMPAERKDMTLQVKEKEPERALFVTNHDPLQFYKAIIQASERQLKVGGILAIEINQQFGKEVVALFEQYQYKNIELLTDLFGNHRFVIAYK